MVPLTGVREDVVGTLAVFWRGREREAPGSEIVELEDLAASAGPTIENAKRFLEARQLAELDALTGLHNRRYFDEVLDREVVARLALRPQPGADPDRSRRPQGDQRPRRPPRRRRGARRSSASASARPLRSTDIACRIGGDEFAVILPESALEDARQLYDRLQAAIGARPLTGGESITASAGIADLEREDDPKALFQRADEALYRAKRDGKGRAR